VFVRKEITNIFTALEQNHAALSKNSETSSRNSNQGAGFVIAAHSYYESGLSCPYTRLSLHSKGFDKRHVSLIIGMVNAFPSLVTDGTLLKEAERLSKQTHEEEQQCTAAELIAGMVRGTMHWEFGEQQKLHQALGSVIKNALATCQPVCVDHWKDCLRVMWSNVDPRRTFWLFHPLCEIAFSTKENDNKDDTGPSTVAKQFKFVCTALVEGSWRASGVSTWVLNEIVSGGWLSHPYKQVRDSVTAILFLVNRNLFSPTEQNKTMEEFIATVDTKLSSLAYIKDEMVEPTAENKDEHDKKSKAEQNYIETILSWVISCMMSGDIRCSFHLFIKFLPHVIKAQHHTDPQCAAIAKMCCNQCSWVNALTADNVAEVITTVTKVAEESKSFDVRASAYKFLWVFIPRYALLLKATTVTSLYKLCEGGMVDNRVEVRLKSYECYTSLLACREQKESKRDRSVKRFMKLARTKVKKEDNTTVGQRHGGVLGLSGFVATHPYDVPTYLPAILAFLASNINDKPPIKGPLRALFAGFKSTHQEQWAVFKELFTEEQLDAVAGVEIAPSYFA